MSLLLLILLILTLVIVGAIFIYTYNSLSNLEEKINREIERIKNTLKRELDLVDEFSKCIKIDYDILEKTYELKEDLETTHSIEELKRYSILINVIFKEIYEVLDINGKLTNIYIEKLLAIRKSLRKKLKEEILNLNEYVIEYNEVLNSPMGSLVKKISDFKEMEVWEDN